MWVADPIGARPGHSSRARRHSSAAWLRRTARPAACAARHPPVHRVGLVARALPVLGDLGGRRASDRARAAAIRRCSSMTSSAGQASPDRLGEQRVPQLDRSRVEGRSSRRSAQRRAGRSPARPARGWSIAAGRSGNGRSATPSARAIRHAGSSSPRAAGRAGRRGAAAGRRLVGLGGELLGEQRLTRRPAVDPVDRRRVGLAARQQRQLLRGLRRGSAGPARASSTTAAGVPARTSHGRLRDGRVVLAPGADDRHARPRRAGARAGRGCRVRPVQVLDDDGQRPQGGQPGQGRADRGEEPLPRPLVVRLGGRAMTRSSSGSSRRRDAATYGAASVRASFSHCPWSRSYVARSRWRSAAAARR